MTSHANEFELPMQPRNSVRSRQNMEMHKVEPKTIVAREKARWFAFSTKLSDDELLRRHERVFNGFTMFFALAILPTWFCGGPLGSIGIFLAIAGEIFIARRLSDLGNQCRDAREVLMIRDHEQNS